MAFLEVIDLLSENDKYKNFMMLEQASYNALLIMNDKAKDAYDQIYKKIFGKEVVLNNILQDIERYKMVTEMLGLKFPND